MFVVVLLREHLDLGVDIYLGTYGLHVGMCDETLSKSVSVVRLRL